MSIFRNRNYISNDTSQNITQDIIIQGVIRMPLISISDLAKELSVSKESITKLIDNKIITPYAGKSRLGEPRFSTKNLSDIRTKIRNNSHKI